MADKEKRKVAKPMPKRYGQGLETIADPGQMFTIIIRLPRAKTSTRGRTEHRNALKAIIAECESRLGAYQKAK